MAHSSRRRLEIEGRVAFLILVASMFANLFAQRHGLVWLQAVSTCVMLVCGLTSAARLRIAQKRVNFDFCSSIRHLLSL
jgi:hypothetical protein